MITRRQSTREGCCTYLETQRRTAPADETSDESSESDSSQQSEDSFPPATSLPFPAKSWRDVKRKLKSLAWIQCDNQHCMKWRKIPRHIAQDISESEKWFCHMNSDPEFSNCDVPEEDVDLYDQLADRSGLKYLKSQLFPGALVWAKMDGYCSWPAVITPEPGTNDGHVHRNEDDDEIESYHVEFLGHPHSHGWVSAKHVKAFTTSSIHKQQAASIRKFGGPGRRKRGKHGRRAILCAPTHQKIRTCYKTGVSVEHGIEEAKDLLPLSPDKRLNKCTYVYKGFCLGAKGTNEHSNSEQNRRQASAADSAGRVEGREGRNRESATTVCHFTSFDTSLNDRTKEERLMLDVEMYKRNERAFEHDVTRFMIRNSLKTPKAPFWQNQRVSLFQLFLAVHERGGYAQVTLKKKWAAVFREVTETPCNKDITYSQAARQFYHRYLYPYELFIHGKDFSKVVSQDKPHTASHNSSTGHCKKHTQSQNKTQTSHNKTQRKKQKSCTTGNNKRDTNEDDIASDSLREMLQFLEENSTLAGLGDGQLENDIDVTFYDDSTPSHAKLPPLTEYEPHDEPMPQNDKVINITSSSSSCVLQDLSNINHMTIQHNQQHKNREQENKEPRKTDKKNREQTYSQMENRQVKRQEQEQHNGESQKRDHVFTQQQQQQEKREHVFTQKPEQEEKREHVFTQRQQQEKREHVFTQQQQQQEKREHVFTQKPEQEEKRERNKREKTEQENRGLEDHSLDDLQIVPLRKEDKHDSSSASGFSQLLLDQLEALQDDINFIDDQIN